MNNQQAAYINNKGKVVEYPLTEEEAFKLLAEVCTAHTGRQAVLHGNQSFWTVPKSFNHKILPKSFDLWVIGDNNNVIRHWSKW